MKSFAVILAPFALLVNSVASTNQLNQSSQVAPEQALSHLEATLRDAEKFSLDLLRQIIKSKAGDDFLISPYALWSLLVPLADATSTGQQGKFHYVLHQDRGSEEIYKTFNKVAGAAEIKSSSIEVAKWQAMFADINQFVKGDYIKLLNTSYSTEVQNLDFNNIQSTTDHINNAIKLRTNGFIESPITADHVRDAKFLMTSTLYLKGRWQLPLDMKPYNVDKIVNCGKTVNLPNFKYSEMRNLEAIITELPLDSNGEFSMFVVQPEYGASLIQVIRNLRMIGLRHIITQLADPSLYRYGYSIHFPIFNATMDISLKYLLEKLGLFNESSAIFLDGLSEGAYLKDIVHRSTITVNKEGIAAAAVDSAIFGGSPLRCRFSNGKPYLYLIVNRITNLIHFAGSTTG